jgi:hypothetical protein
MAMRPAHPAHPAGPVSVEVPFRREQPPWWPSPALSPAPAPAPSPGAPAPGMPVYSPVRVSNPYRWPGIGDRPGSQERPDLYERLLERRIVMAHGHLDAEGHRVLTAAEAERYGLLTGQIERR